MANLPVKCKELCFGHVRDQDASVILEVSKGSPDGRAGCRKDQLRSPADSVAAEDTQVTTVVIFKMLCTAAQQLDLKN